MGTRKRWPGGYIATDANGIERYFIEKKIRGRKFHFSTSCSTLRAAMKQLERFEEDPLNFRAPQEQELLLTPKLILEYNQFQLTVRKGTGPYVREIGRALGRWMGHIGDIDLRRLTLRDHIKPALGQMKGGNRNLVAIKGFLAWLRKEKHLMTSAQDCTLDLPIPQSTPEKWKRRKAATQEHVRAMAEHLNQRYRDVLNVLCATGWHVTEVDRFVRGIDADMVIPPKREGSPLAVLVVRHKTGDMTRTPIMNPEHIDSINRLRKEGTMPRWIGEAFKEASAKAGVPTVYPGSMRHSVLTWAVEAGADPAKVAQFANHKSTRTTMRFYVDVAVPTATIPTMSV